jgi:hypothetical protein
MLADEFIDVLVENLGRVLAFDVGAANRASGALSLPLFETISAVRVSTVESGGIDEHLFYVSQVEDIFYAKVFFASS